MNFFKQKDGIYFDKTEAEAEPVTLAKPAKPSATHKKPCVARSPKSKNLQLDEEKNYTITKMAARKI